MKRMHYLLAGLIIPAMLTSCSSEDGVVETPIPPSDNDLPVVKLYANSGGSNTRTTIDGSGTVKWSQTDKINVNGKISTNTEIAPDGRTAIFEVLAKKPYAAVYPASVVTKFDENMFTVDIPNTQKHKDGDSFADDVNISVAYSETDKELSFKNICGLLKVTIKVEAGVRLENITKARFYGGKYIAGMAKLDPKTGGIDFPKPATTMIDVVFDTPLTITEAEEIKVIWSLLPANFNNWFIQLFDEYGNIYEPQGTEHNPPIDLGRSKIVSIIQTFSYK